MDNDAKKRLRPKILIIALIATVFSIVVIAYGLWIAAISPRHRWITPAIRSGGSENIVTSEISVSRTGLAFSLYNSTDEDTTYGEFWELVRWRFGRWHPVSHRGVNRFMSEVALSFPSGAINQYHIEWDWLFGELQNGRYMFIRKYFNDYLLIEFTIDADTSTVLP